MLELLLVDIEQAYNELQAQPPSHTPAPKADPWTAPAQEPSRAKKRWHLRRTKNKK
jgi:hypothetical protein